MTVERAPLQRQDHPADSRAELRGDLPFQRRLRHAQLHLLFEALPLSLAGSSVLASLLVVVLWRSGNAGALLGWLLAVLALMLARLHTLRLWRRRGGGEPGVQLWRLYFHVGNILSGLLWGAGSVLFFPVEPHLQNFLIFVIAGVSAGAMANLAAERVAALLFAVPCVLPLGLQLLWRGDLVSIVMGSMVLFYLAILGGAVQVQHRHIMSALSNELRWREAESALRISESRLAAIVDKVVDAIITIDTGGRLLSFNTAAERIFGYRAAEVVGRNVGMLMPDPPRSDHDGFIARYLAGGEPHILGQGREVMGLRRGGDIFPMELAVSESKTAGQHFFTGIVRDISVRKRREQALAQTSAKLMGLLNAATQVCVIGTDVNGTVTEFNSGAELMLGYRNEEMIGCRTPEMLHLRSELEARSLELSQQLGRPVRGFEVFVWSAREDRPERRTWTYIRKDGGRLSVDLMVSAVRDTHGLLLGFLGVAVDITAQLQAQQAESLARAQLEAFVEYAPAAVAMLDTELRYIAYSQRWLSAYNLQGQNLIGRGHYEVFPEIGPEWRAIHQRCLHGAIERREEDAFDRADGTRQWLRWEVRPWRDGRGRIGGIVMLTEEITERKREQQRLQELNERFRLATRAGGIGVWQWELLGNGLVWDARMFEIYNLPLLEGERLLERWRNLLHPGDRERINDAVVRALTRGEPFDAEFRVLLENGAERCIRAAAEVTRSDDGTPIRLTGINIDISDIKRAEQLKNEFVATVSHELRTPLTSIRGTLELLAGGVAGELPEKARQLVGIARDNSLRLSALINDLLDIERIEAGHMRLDLQEQPLLPLLQQSLQANAGYAETLNVCFELELSGDQAAAAVVDSQRFQQVMANLLSNAAKFSSAGGIVEVGFITKPGCIRIEVRDRGPGIAPEFNERIFAKFSQADSSDSRTKGGTGLGLAISRALVELQGGTIGFAPREGGGTLFFVELPAVDGVA